jgi:hypothetical protein
VPARAPLPSVAAPAASSPASPGRPLVRPVHRPTRLDGATDPCASSGTLWNRALYAELSSLPLASRPVAARLVSRLRRLRLRQKSSLSPPRADTHPRAARPGRHCPPPRVCPETRPPVTLWPHGALAQRESTCLAGKGSGVRIPDAPPQIKLKSPPTGGFLMSAAAGGTQKGTQSGFK